MNLLAITLLRFTFIYVFKRIPSMDDNFLSFYIRSSIVVTATLLATVAATYNENTVIAEAICANVLPDHDNPDKRFVPIVPIIVIVCVIGHLILRIAIRQKKIKMPANQRQNENSINLGYVKFNSITKVSLATLAFTYILIAR